MSNMILLSYTGFASTIRLEVDKNFSRDERLSKIAEVIKRKKGFTVIPEIDAQFYKGLRKYFIKTLFPFVF